MDRAKGGLMTRWTLPDHREDSSLHPQASPSQPQVTPSRTPEHPTLSFVQSTLSLPAPSAAAAPLISRFWFGVWGFFFFTFKHGSQPLTVLGGNTVGLSLTAESTDSAMTYADIICLVMKNLETRKRKLRRLYQLHENEWAYFNNYLMELQENFER